MEDAAPEQPVEEKLCEMCSIQPRKYKCPGCGMFTCSLECCRGHKTKTGCTGVRDKTKYISMKTYKENELRSDYHFLEDVVQTKDRANRIYTKDCLGKKGTKTTKFPQNKKKPVVDVELFNTNTYQNLENYPKSVKTLFNATKERKTKLIFQPPGMSRRQENTTQYNPTTNVISWKMTAIFVMTEQCTSHELNVFDMNMIGKETITSLQSNLIGHNLATVDETFTIAQLLEKLIETMPTGSSLRQLVKAWSIPIEQVHCLIKVLPSPANNPLFKQVNLTATIKEMLTDHTIIEFPTVYFVHTPALSCFRMLIVEELSEEEKKLLFPFQHQPNDDTNNNNRKKKQRRGRQQKGKSDNNADTTNNEGNNNSNEISSLAHDNNKKEGEEEGEIDEEDHPNKRPRVELITPMKEIQQQVEHDDEVEEGEELEVDHKEEGEGEMIGDDQEEEEEDAEDCEDFMAQFADLQDLDEAQLLQIIRAEEEAVAKAAAAANQ